MAFPTVVARTTSEQASDSSSFSVGLGSPSAGELIVSIISIDASSSSALWIVDQGVSGKNWLIFPSAVSNIAVQGLVAIKIANGSDALTVINLDGGAQQASAITFRISGHGSYVSVSSAIGNSTNGDPPNVAITGAAQDCLFISALCTDAQVVASAAPTSYGNLTTKAATNAAGASVSVADRNLNASSDNPSTFTNTAEQWVAFSIAIPENNITTNARTSQASLEATSSISPSLYATQVAMEVPSANSLNMIVTQVAVETLTPQTQNFYATQVAIEVLSGDPWPAANNSNKYRQIQIAC